jgi:hypothetical protein
MSPELIQLLSSGGAGAAVVVLSIFFLRFLREERKQLMDDRREERREFLARLEQISVAVETLNTTLSGRPCMLERDGGVGSGKGEREHVHRGAN